MMLPKYTITSDKITNLENTLDDIKPEVTSLTEKFNQQDNINERIKKVLNKFIHIIEKQHHVNELVLEEFEDQTKLNDILKTEIENIKTKNKKLKLWIIILGVSSVITLLSTIIQWFI